VEILSLWRSPLDKVALSEAQALSDRQPRGSTFGEDFSPLTIYNYGYYVTNATGHDPNTALTNMFQAMSSPASLPYSIPAGVGGTAFIPQGSFQVTASSSGFSVPDQCNVIGSGGGGPSTGGGASNFFHFIVSPPAGETAPSTFLNCDFAHTCGGKFFRNLAFEWGTTTYADICISTASGNAWNTRAINCTFTNCPVAFNASGLSCGMEQCTVQYNTGPAGNGPTGSGAFASVVLGGSQCYIAGPGEYLQPTQAGITPPSTNPPTDTCCISFQSGLEHGIVSDLHISHFSYGITYGINSHNTIFHCVITNVEFSVFNTCVYMQPSDSHGTIYDQKYIGCVFSLENDSTQTSSLVYVSAIGGSVNDVQFVGCTTYQGLGHGYEFKSGSNIQIVGGTSSGNGPSGGAGIAITGNASPCTFIGVNLDASYPDASNVQSQNYAFVCSGNPTKAVLLDGCPMLGYSTSPVSITGSPADLIITNCPGYNDLNTVIAPTAPLSTVTAASASLITGGTNYYGPSLLIFTNGASPVTFTMNSVASTVPANAFVVMYLPSPNDEFLFSSAPAHFTWLGK